MGYQKQVAATVAALLGQVFIANHPLAQSISLMPVGKPVNTELITAEKNNDICIILADVITTKVIKKKRNWVWMGQFNF